MREVESLYLTSVVPSATRLVLMGADVAPFTPYLCQCTVLRVFKAMATRIRGKSKQTLKSLKIESETSRSESRALANWHDCSNWNVVELLFRGENLSSQRKTSRSREENQQQTRAPYVTEPGNRNPAHIGGGRVLSPLRHPCSRTSALRHPCFAGQQTPDQFGKEILPFCGRRNIICTF